MTLEEIQALIDPREQRYEAVVEHSQRRRMKFLGQSIEFREVTQFRIDRLRYSDQLGLLRQESFAC